MKNNGSQTSWMGGLLICAAVFFLGRGFFPGILKTILTLLAIGSLLVVAVIAVFVINAIRKGNTPEAQAKQERDKTLAKGRTDLVQLKGLVMQVKNTEVSALGNGVCASMEQIIKTLKTQPENVSSMRQFFNYYLPTTASILTRFVKVEQSGVDMGDMAENAVSCLKDIKSAMDKLYKNLFDDDILDLSVEMEALTLACKRDGLLNEDEFSIPDENSPVKLTL